MSCGYPAREDESEGSKKLLAVSRRGVVPERVREVPFDFTFELIENSLTGV